MLEHIQADYPEIVLASGSAARAAILGSAGIRFRQQPSTIDEEEERKLFASGTSPREVALHLARIKAGAVFKKEPDAVVIGGDQVLAVGNEILQKPGESEGSARATPKAQGARA